MSFRAHAKIASRIVFVSYRRGQARHILWLYVRPFVCSSQVGIARKRLSESSSLRPRSCHRLLLHRNGIRLSLKAKVLPCETLSQTLDLEIFRCSTSAVASVVIVFDWRSSPVYHTDRSLLCATRWAWIGASRGPSAIAGTCNTYIQTYTICLWNLSFLHCCMRVGAPYISLL